VPVRLLEAPTLAARAAPTRAYRLLPGVLVAEFGSTLGEWGVLWIESRRAVVAGDALVDFGRGLEIPQESLTKGVTREQVVEGLRPLLALPVEVVLPAHGAPTDRAALERASPDG
jgi:hypothetical protein